MKLLAVDTATERCSVALWMDGEIIQRERLLNRAHAEAVLPMVNEVLAEAGFALSQMDGIAFGRGPGGFTGVRVAVSVAQGLAFGTGLPVLPVSDLAAVAYGVFRRHAEQRIMVCMDARMGEVYAGAYAISDSQLQLVGDESVVEPDAVVLPDAGRWHGAGTGFTVYASTLRVRLGVALSGVDADVLPEARDVATLGAQACARGEALSADRALPVYLRDRVAWPKPGV